MRKLFSGNFGVLLLAMTLALTFTSCEKQVVSTDTSQSISFAFENPMLDGFGKKNADDIIPVCSDSIPTYVTVLITDAGGTQTEYMLDILALDNSTELLQLPAGAYNVDEFFVHAQGGTIIYAAPHVGSDYAIMFEASLTNLVVHSFTLDAFEKERNNIDVLCYEPAVYDMFGFKHFKYHAYEVREKCFFGDICTKFYADFATYEGNNNPYYGWPTHYDMYGFFTVTVTDAAGNITKSTNMGVNPGDIANFVPEDMVVCVKYLDDLEAEGEVYDFTLDVHLPDGSTMTLVDSTFTDANPNPFGGEDGIFTWAIGNCNSEYNNIDYTAPALLFLPSTGVIDVVAAAISPTHFEYFDVKLVSGFDGALYPAELFNGAQLGAWCGDLMTPIASGTYQVDVYSSLKPLTLPLPYQGYNWGTLNWLANQSHGIAANLTDASELQALIWAIIHEGDATLKSKIMTQFPVGAHPNMTSANVDAIIAAGAAANANPAISGFVPRTGDWSIVVFDPRTKLAKNNSDEYKKEFQLLLVRVDP